MSWPVERRRELFAGDATPVLKRAGMTWESVAGWLQGPLTAEVWTALIPAMGYMALLRNLRNLDQAGVSDEVAATVAAKLADPEQVARSRQLPMRFLSAYRAAPSLRWAWALERALNASLATVPSLPAARWCSTLPSSAVPRGVPVYTWNLAGYEFGHTEGRFTFGGLSDAAFGMVPLLEAGGREVWPF